MAKPVVKKLFETLKKMASPFAYVASMLENHEERLKALEKKAGITSKSVDETEQA